MNKIRTIIMILMIISSIGTANAVTVSSEVKDGLVKISISVSSTDEQTWGVYIDAKTDHGEGQGGRDEAYPYFVERVTGTGNNEFTRMYSTDDYLATLASHGIGTVDFSVFSVLPAPTLTPTPTPTPSPTPTPTPTPTPEPTPVTIAVVQPAIVHAAPAPESNFGSYLDDGTLNFDSTPRGATIYINRQKLGTTPRSRDLTPGPYRIEFRMEGYYNFSKDVIVKEDKSIDINVTMEPIEVQKAPEVVMPVHVMNDTKSDNVTTATTTQKPSNTTLFYVVSLVAMIVAVIALWYISKKNKTDTVATADKIASMLRANPDYKNADMAERLGVDIRSVERHRKKLGI